jgi:EAL domain-containing protein (putative c-di-GMP-specific phosphodiesterase class I)
MHSIELNINGLPMQALVKKTSSSETSAIARATLSTAASRIFSALPALQHGRGWATYPFNTLTLNSHYQPILSAKDGSLFGYEALLMANNLVGQRLNPEVVFAISADQEEQLFLDWLCRALHLRNIANIGSGQTERGYIFLNAYPQASIEDPHHPNVFQSMLEFYSINPRDVVVEILETGASDDAHLVDAANLYRRLGCKIAIDDFGVGFSNFERLWRLRPDFVKIDRSLLKSAANEHQARLVLANMIRLIKSCGAKVIIEGIEERGEAKLALELEADYLQGFYFAKPEQAAFPAALGHQMVSQLIDEKNAAQKIIPNQIERHAICLTGAAISMAHGMTFTDAIQEFLAEPNAVRAYLLDEPSQSASRITIEMSEDQAWLNLPTPDSSIWRIRNTLDRAFAEPNTIQVATPLLLDSIPMAPTVTLSYAFDQQGRTLVLCGEVLATELMAVASIANDEHIKPTVSNNIVSIKPDLTIRV